MVKDTFSVGLIIVPLSYVLAAVSPCLGSHSLPHCVLPFPLISDSIIKFDSCQLDESVTVDCGLYELIVLFSFTSFEEIRDSLLDLAVSVGFRFYGFWAGPSGVRL